MRQLHCIACPEMCGLWTGAHVGYVLHVAAVVMFLTVHCLIEGMPQVKLKGGATL
jgi:hypothetical protein